MKPQKFYIGQEVTLKAKPKGYSLVWGTGGGDYDVPRFGEIYVVAGYEAAKKPGDENWYLLLDGIRGAWGEAAFVPVRTTKVLELELEGIELTTAN